MRTIAVVTVGRSDYGIYRPVLRRIVAENRLRLVLIAAGMHLSARFGWTIREIEADGFTVDERVDMLLASDTPAGIAKSMGLGTVGFAQVYSRVRPDILVVLGDRAEMHAAAVAAVPFTVPVAHIHGGELTYGAYDDALRHSLTKLSHLHFVSTAEYGRRVVQMGEEPWRVTVSGAPALDNLREVELLGPQDVAARYGVSVDSPFLLATFHPVTLEHEKTEWQVGEMLAALDTIGLPVVFTAPNADVANDTVRRLIDGFVQAHPNTRFFEHLGTQGYWSLMATAAALVGNSSSGIVEAPSFRVPVVNIGRRQAGRVRAGNVIDVDYHREAVAGGIRAAIEPGFRPSLCNLVNPYGDGHAAETIVRRLSDVVLDTRLITKQFADAASVTAIHAAERSSIGR